MNATYIHLLLNHFPILGTLIGGILLAFGLFYKNESIKKAAAVILVIMSITAIPVYLTGEPAEDSIEKLPGISESMIEMHEEAATIAIWLMMATGAGALVSLVMGWLKKGTSAAYIITCSLALLCFAAMARTGYYGGKIRHTEILTNAANSTAPANETKQELNSEKDDD